jgi:Flp pilus assembly protein TadD
MGDLNGAVLDYDQCLTLAPTDADAYARRGMVLLQLGKATQACADFRSALQYGNSDAAQLLNKYCH